MGTTTQTSAGKRIEALLDDNSFVEIGGLVTARNTDFNMTDIDTPADGVITGYGTINGGLVYVYSQDVTVLGGAPIYLASSFFFFFMSASRAKMRSEIVIKSPPRNEKTRKNIAKFKK